MLHNDTTSTKDITCAHTFYWLTFCQRDFRHDIKKQTEIRFTRERGHFIGLINDHNLACTTDILSDNSLCNDNIRIFNIAYSVTDLGVFKTSVIFRNRSVHCKGAGEVWGLRYCSQQDVVYARHAEN